MKIRANTAVGRFVFKLWHEKDSPRIQIITVEALLDGSEHVDASREINPFAMVERSKTPDKQTEMQ